jgi:transposase
MPEPGRRGRPREVEFRKVINAVRYLVRSGCGWRMLPVHFGHWRTVNGWFRELARRFLFQTIYDVELMLERIGLEACSLTAWLHDELRTAGLSAICIETCQCRATNRMRTPRTIPFSAWSRSSIAMLRPGAAQALSDVQMDVLSSLSFAATLRISSIMNYA